MSRIPDFDALDIEPDGSWLTVWFNEPEKRNPLTSRRIADLEALCSYLDDNREIRGVTFRGRGGVFSAGGDLKAFRAIAEGRADEAEITRTSIQAGTLFERIENLRQVTVMIVDGGAVAGGIGLACAGDIVISARAARFALTEVRIGLVPAQIAPFIIRRTGISAARRLMVTAAAFDGGEAATLGIADIVCDTDDEIAAAEKRIREDVLQCAPGAIADTKQLLRDLEGCTGEERRRIAAQCFAGRIFSAEGGEGLAAFLERRKPSWANGGNGE